MRHLPHFDTMHAPPGLEADPRTPATGPQPAWAALDDLVLSLIFQQLSALLQADQDDEFLSLAVAEAAAAGAACCRHWAHVSCRELRLSVRCRSSVVTVQALLHLAHSCVLVGLSFNQQTEDEQAAVAVHALLSDAGFQQLAGRHLSTLLGAPCSAEGGKSAAGRSTLHHFDPSAFTSLRRLQLHMPLHQQVLSLRNPAWLAAAALRHLSISGRHYVALRVLPPNLCSLNVSAWHVLADPQLLVQCPQVYIRAAAVLMAEHVLPYFAAGLTPAAVEAWLRELAELLAAAGLPEGHSITLDTNLVCWQRPRDGSEAKLAAPAEDVLLGAAAAGASSWQLQAAAGGVDATMAAPPSHSVWPSELGPNAPQGSGPEMRILLRPC